MLSGSKSMFGSFSGHASEDEEEVYLNLTPMIDILTCLLFFLLLSFGAVIIALINASIPVQAGESEPNASAQRVTMGVSVTEKALLVTASNDSMSEEELNKLKRTFGKKGADHDYAGLHEYMWKVKSRFPSSATVIITPEPKISYEVLVRVMDATRERAGGTARRPIKVPMFPEAVVSTLVQ